jgi:hypothetical protein
MPLTDDLHYAIMQAAAPVTSSERAQFLAELKVELERHAVIGPGLVHRTVAMLQRKYTVEARAAAAYDGQRDALMSRHGRIV